MKRLRSLLVLRLVLLATLLFPMATGAAPLAPGDAVAPALADGAAPDAPAPTASASLDRGAAQPLSGRLCIAPCWAPADAQPLR